MQAVQFVSIGLHSIVLSGRWGFICRNIQLAQFLTRLFGSLINLTVIHLRRMRHASISARWWLQAYVDLSH